MYIYRAGSQRKYIRTLLIPPFDPQFPRPKLLPTNRSHKKIDLHWVRTAHMLLPTKKRENPTGQRGFLFPKEDNCTNVVGINVRGQIYVVGINLYREIYRQQLSVIPKTVVPRK